MSKRLLVISGPEAGRAISIDEKFAATIGRGKASDVRMNDPRISRVHCRVEVSPDGVSIADAGSTGGTFVRGQRITKHFLAHGDEIQIGESRLRFESGEAATDEGRKRQVPGSKALNDLVGQTLGHFRLDHIAHSGRTSVLFSALDQRHVRRAMVKVMLPTVTADEVQRHRFVRAVHTMISIRHDNLVELYGAGKQGPLCWCAMEYVDDVSIMEIIEQAGVQGRLDWREVHRIAVQVARALECATKHKVIHRNVTPDNLIQRRDDKIVKVIDLVLAKALEGTQCLQVTAPGQLVGDVAYMSPERIDDTSALDWRSDQYGLGASLYALLTGRPPFTAPSLEALVKAIRNEEPAFPPEVRAETPDGFQQTVLKMLAKSPHDRFLEPSELLGRLDETGKE